MQNQMGGMGWDALIQQLVKAADAGLRQMTSTAPTLSAWLDLCAAQRSSLAETTKLVNRHCGGFLRRHFVSDPRIDQITRQQAAQWRTALADGTLSRQSIQHTRAPNEQTVCKYVRAARKIFAEAFDQDLISFNPFDRLKGTPPQVVREWTYLSQADMQKIFDACPSDAWRAFFGLLRYAGLRLSEAQRLRWADVDFERNRIIACAAGTIGKQSNKKRPRIIPIEAAHCPSGFFSVLQTAFTNREETVKLVCAGLPSDIDEHTVAIVEKAGVARYAKIHHTLRKNAEMDWAGKYPQHVASEWAGHSILVSAAHYLRVPEELYHRPAA